MHATVTSVSHIPGFVKSTVARLWTDIRRSVWSMQTNVMRWYVIEKSREWYSHKLQPIPDTKRKRKRTEMDACKISKQMPKKYTDQLSLPKARWSQCYKTANSSHAVRDLGRVRQYPPWLLFAAFVDSVGYPRYNPQKTRKQWRTRDRRFHWLWGWFPDLKIIFMM